MRPISSSQNSHSHQAKCKTSDENVFYLHENKKSFLYQRFGTSWKWRTVLTTVKFWYSTFNLLGYVYFKIDKMIPFTHAI